MRWPFVTSSNRERQLDSELEFHLQSLIEEKLALGKDLATAQREASIEFGGSQQWKEECRDVNRLPFLEAAALQLGWAFRSLRKSPGFVAVVSITLALGIGANSAVFSALNAVLFRPLAYPDAEQLTTIHQLKIRDKSPESFVAPQRVEDWNRLSKAFSAISGFFTQDVSELSGRFPERLHEVLVAPRFLRVLGVAPALGRNFSAAEEHFGGPNAVLISDAYWHRRFGGKSDSLGKILRLDNVAYTVIGVMPHSFVFPDRNADIWCVSPPDAPYAQDRASTWFTVIGRLRPGRTITQGRLDLASVQAGLSREFPKTDRQLEVEVQALKDTVIQQSGRSLWLLFGSVSLLLLIACTNVAALLLARTADRAHEIGIRYSLGASRRSVISLLLTESLLLSLGGSAVGLLLAFAVSTLLRNSAKALPRAAEITLDGRVVAYTLVCSILATFLFGLVPALDASRRSIAGSLAGRTRGHVSLRRPLQWSLVGGQVALAVILLLGAALLLRSFSALAQVAPGFDSAHVLTLQVSGNWGETADRLKLQRRIESDLDALRALPGITTGATSATLPGAADAYPAELQITDASRKLTDIVSDSKVVSDGYFETMRIPMLAGSGCSRQASWNTVVVNRRFAEKFAGVGSLVGHHVNWIHNPYGTPPAEISGIAADARENGLAHAPEPIVYWCANSPNMSPYFLLRTAGNPVNYAQDVRLAMKKIEPQRSVFDIVPLTDHLFDARAETRLRTTLLTGFALTALFLAGVGLYGTLNYFVNTRRREIGLRMALGAIPRQILVRSLAQGLSVAIAGCLAGLLLGVAFSRALAGMLFGISHNDPLTYAATAIMMMSIAALACTLPSVRAARLDPMRTLRDE